MPSTAKNDEQRQGIETKQGKTTPSDGDDRRKDRANAGIRNQIDGKREPEKRDNDNVEFHAVLAQVCGRPS